MSQSWDQSSAAARLRAAGELEIAAPPPLAGVREVAGRRARRAAQLMAFAVALPLGAMAAGGAYVWKAKTVQPVESVTPSTSPVRALPRVAPEVPALPTVVEAEPVAEAPRPAPRKPTVTPAPAQPIARAAPAPAAVPPPETPAVAGYAPGKSIARSAPAHTAVPTPEIPAVAGYAPGKSIARSAPAHTAVPTPEIPAVAGYAPALPPARTALAEESSSLSQAFAALRVQRDPARALALLTTYRERFPAGALRHEAALATVEAHRALGHTPEALAALDALPHRPELDVLRGELNAELGRCEEARAALRGLAVTGALLERALFTDATCALTLGARDEAVADLERLPESARAKALLEKLR